MPQSGNSHRVSAVSLSALFSPIFSGNYVFVHGASVTGLRRRNEVELETRRSSCSGKGKTCAASGDENEKARRARKGERKGERGKAMAYAASRADHREHETAMKRRHGAPLSETPAKQSPGEKAATVSSCPGRVS